MYHLHRNRVGGEARDHPEDQVPEARVALIAKLGEEIERRIAGRRQHEGLQLIPPHGVPEQPNRVVDGEEDKEQVW